MFKINTIENNNRMSTQDLLLAISDALAKGETEFNIEASGQHDIGGPLWHPEGKKLKFHVKNAGQRVGSMCLDNTEIIVEDSASADVGWLNAGGKIVVKGNAGKQCGECLTGGRIHVLGNCDILAGIHMTKGIIEIDGDVNRWPGGQMKNGNIVIHGFLGRLLEGFVLEGVVDDPEIDGEVFKGKYIQYKGDIGLNGKGALYLDAEANREKLAHYNEIDDEYTSIREYRNL